MCSFVGYNTDLHRQFPEACLAALTDSDETGSKISDLVTFFFLSKSFMREYVDILNVRYVTFTGNGSIGRNTFSAVLKNNSLIS